jgi:hypothetical protein
MNDMLFVPGLQTTVLSCRALVKAGIDVTSSRNGCTLKDADDGADWCRALWSGRVMHTVSKCGLQRDGR